MASRELSCPICDADLPLAGDERKGDQIFCEYCRAPSRLSADAKSEECEAEEDL